MSTTIDRLSGFMAVDESTMTTSIAAPVIVGAGTLVGAEQPGGERKRNRRSKLAALLRRKSGVVSEDSEVQPVIPKDAVPDGESVAGREAPELGSAKGKSAGIEPQIPTSVALVAPDTTPNSTGLLDPSQVPAAVAQPVSPPVQHSPPLPGGKDDVIRTLLGQHQSAFDSKSAAATPEEALAAVQKAMSGEPLVEGEAVPGPSKNAVVQAKASEAAGKLISEAQSGVAQKHHFNPQSMSKAVAVTRALFDGK